MNDDDELAWEAHTHTHTDSPTKTASQGSSIKGQADHPDLNHDQGCA